MRIVRAIRPISSPHTLHAWTATYTVHIQFEEEQLPGLSRGRWVDVDELHDVTLAQMWPDHQRAALAALM